MKTGLVMEGGAMRGMFTCGVTDVLMEQGITFQGAGGISAGATFGCNVKSGQIGRALRYNKRFCRDPRYCSLRSLLRTGDLYGAEFCYRTLPDELDIFDRQAYRENPMDFFVGATDVATGEIVYRNCTAGDDDDMTWIRASASMPLVSRPVEAGGRLYLDGGIVEPTPFFHMEARGYDRCVTILTRPADYRKGRDPLTGAYRLLLRRYPALAAALAARPARYNAHIAAIREREAAGKTLVIRPRAPLNIGHTEKNPAELERVYRLGRAEAVERLEEIRAFLNP